MNTRFKSITATVLVHVALGYVLFVGLGMQIPRFVTDRIHLINLTPDRVPPPPRRIPPPPPKVTEEPVDVSRTTSYTPPPPDGPDWMTMTPMQRLQSVIKTQAYVVKTVKDEATRIAGWRLFVPQGTGAGKVTRVRPSNLTTHTLYWPPSWSKGLLPIIVWGNDYEGKCSNTSLPYAGFLAEIASHGYFVVAVGNDDIDFPRTGGPDLTPDGRLMRVQASALTKGVDWAIAENSRAGSPYQGKIDTSKIAYMGHGCGGGQAMDAGFADPRTTTIVLLNASGRFRPGSSDGFKAPIAHFEGLQDDGGVVSSGEANFARAQATGWPMFIAALIGTAHEEVYQKPDPRWTKAVVAWLDLQLKGDREGSVVLNNLWRNNWTNVGATGL